MQPQADDVQGQNIKKNKEKKPVYGIYIGCTLVILFLMFTIYTGFSVWNRYKNTIIEKQEEQMLVIAESLADNLEDKINSYCDDINRLASLIEFVAEEKSPTDFQEKLLSEYMGNDQDFVANLILSDENGKVLWNQNQATFNEVYGRFQIDKDMVLEEVRCNEDEFYFSIQKQMPDGRSLTLLVDIADYYQNLISDIRLGTNGYVVVKDSEGTIIMHPEIVQWGKTVIDGREKLYQDVDLTSLKNLVKLQNEQESGVGEYYSYWWTDENLPRVKKVSAFSRAQAGDDYMIVSAVMDYADIYQPISSGFMTIVLTFGCIFTILMIFASVFFYLAVQRRRNQKEIQYLKDLNHVLEETRRGEEVIAHQQRLQIMGTMTGGIAHEFNNLLTPIMGYADMLMDGLPEESESYDYAKEIFEASDKAKDVIHQIAGLSRKNMETVYSFVPIKKALRRSVKMIQSVCPANISFTCKEEFESEGYQGNETQLNQVLLNICVNAFHAIENKTVDTAEETQSGKVILEGSVVSCETLEKRHQMKTTRTWKEYLCLKITDNGCGMDSEIMNQIFDPFFTTKVGGQGTGLGLSIVEQIVHSHKGYIFVESKNGEGSCFSIYLPRAEEAAGSIAESQEGRKVTLHMLILDDNGKVLGLLERGLKKLGVSITSVNNTKDARKLLLKERFDVILIDQDLSKTDNDDSGTCFAMAISSVYPDMIKIIMTSQIRKEIIEAKQHGYIDDYVEKPVSDMQIVETIYRIKPKY